MVQFESWASFFAMGGHGLYVWLAYGATFLVLAISYLSVRGARKRLQQELSWLSGEGGGATQEEETKL